VAIRVAIAARVPAAVSRAACTAIARPGSRLGLTADRPGHDPRDLIFQRTAVGVAGDERRDDITDLRQSSQGFCVP